MDRAKPPPHAIRPPETFDHSIGGHQWIIHLIEEDEAQRVIAESPEECIRLAWEHYDRITAPARAALLRELAAELETRFRLGSAYFEAANDEDALDRWELKRRLELRADALEAGTTLNESLERARKLEEP